MLEYLKIYYGLLLDNELFNRDSQCPTSLSLGGDPGLDSVLEWVRPEIGRLVGFEFVDLLIGALPVRVFGKPLHALD